MTSSKNRWPPPVVTTRQISSNPKFHIFFIGTTRLFAFFRGFEVWTALYLSLLVSSGRICANQNFAFSTHETDEKLNVWVLPAPAYTFFSNIAVYSSNKSFYCRHISNGHWGWMSEFTRTPNLKHDLIPNYTKPLCLYITMLCQRSRLCKIVIIALMSTYEQTHL